MELYDVPGLVYCFLRDTNNLGWLMKFDPTKAFIPLLRAALVACIVAWIFWEPITYYAVMAPYYLAGLWEIFNTGSGL